MVESLNLYLCEIALLCSFVIVCTPNLQFCGIFIKGHMFDQILNAIATLVTHSMFSYQKPAIVWLYSAYNVSIFL
jgi:hypothetical protein